MDKIDEGKEIERELNPPRQMLRRLQDCSVVRLGELSLLSGSLKVTKNVSRYAMVSAVARQRSARRSSNYYYERGRVNAHLL